MRRFGTLVLLLFVAAKQGQAVPHIGSGGYIHSSFMSIRSGSIQLQKRMLVTRHPKADELHRTVTIRYPIVIGGVPLSVQRRVQTALLPQTVFKMPLHEMQNDGWLQETNYTVNYNRNGILNVTFSTDGVGAYPSHNEMQVTLSLETGQHIRARDLFRAASIPALITRVNRMMQADMKAALANAVKEGGGDSVRDMLAGVHASEKDLDTMKFGPKGITFLHDYGFPHVILALEPNSQYFIPYNILKPYARSGGPLKFLF